MRAPDQIDVAQRAVGQVLAHPLTWAPFAPIAGAYAFLGTPWWVCLPAAVIAAGGVAAVWARRWSTLSEKVRTAALVSFRRDENLALEARIQRLSKSSEPARPPVVPSRLQTLREAVEIKRAVEQRLFADGVVIPHEMEVGQMIADLARTMVEETEWLYLTQGQPPGESTAMGSERFDQAARTLRQSFRDLDVILDPVPPSLKLPQEVDDPLTKASDRLAERIRQAHDVRRLMEERLPSDVSSSSPTSPVPPPTADRRHQPLPES